MGGKIKSIFRSWWIMKVLVVYGSEEFKNEVYEDVCKEFGDKVVRRTKDRIDLETMVIYFVPAGTGMRGFRVDKLIIDDTLDAEMVRRQFYPFIRPFKFNIKMSK